MRKVATLASGWSSGEERHVEAARLRTALWYQLPLIQPHVRAEGCMCRVLDGAQAGSVCSHGACGLEGEGQRRR